MVESKSDLISKVKHIEITTKKSVMNLFSGMYLSVFKGRGIESEDVREFQEGDDIRSISWSKTAQMGKPFVKNFREERDLSVMLLVDISGSVDFGSHFEKKRDRIAEIGALLAFSAIFNNDRVGMLLFSDTIEKCILPKRGMRHGIRLLRELLAYEPSSKGTDMVKALDYLNKISKKPVICFLLSDFLTPDFSKTLTITAKRHDVVAIRVFDSEEKEPPDLGLVWFQDLETNKISLVHMDGRQAKKLEEQYKTWYEKLHSTIARAGVGFIEIPTYGPFLEKIGAYFKARKKQR